MDAPLYLGIDVGGTHVQAGVVGADGRIIARAHRPTDGGGGDVPALNAIDQAARAALTAASRTLEEVAAIGVAAAGAMDAARGLVLESPNLGWKNLPLRDLLARMLGRPVVIENDVNAAALGEWRAAGGEGDLLAVWVGTGVGGGLVLSEEAEGRIHHGRLRTAGEIGHVVLLPDAPAGSRTVEDLCSRRGLRTCMERAGVPGARTMDASAIANGWRERDAKVAPLVDRAADLLGLVIANTVTLLAVERVVIGGGMTESLGMPWIERIAASFEANVFPRELRACRTEMTRLHGDAGIAGAAEVARRGAASGA